MKKLLINGWFLNSRNKTGVYRFALEVLLELDRQLTKNMLDYEQILVVVPRYTQNIPQLQIMQIVYSGNFRNQYLWEQINLAWYARGNFLINLANFAPLLKRQQLCVIHDALVFNFPQAYSRKFVYLTKFFQYWIVRHSHCIATVSNFSKQEICKHIGKPRQPIWVLGNSAQHLAHLVADDEVLTRNQLVAGKYILAVFSQKNSAYKNVKNYLAAIAPLKYKFVCVGNLGAEATAATNLINIGFVSDNELKSLYSNAYAFIIPSLYEGFGIPLLEAAMCGCPILAASIPVLREVGLDKVLYFDPNEPSKIREAIVRILADNNLRQQLAAKSKLIPPNYSWSTIATTILQALSKRTFSSSNLSQE